MTENKTYKRAGLIGVGLIGSSVALGLRKAGIVETWVGMDANPHAIEEALRIDAIQEMTTDLKELVTEVEWLLIAIPVRGTAALAERLIPLINRPDYFIIDVGSTKKTIVETFDAQFAALKKPNAFVGCHPIAGKEKTGPLAADSDLFQDKTIYLTPSKESNSHLVEEVESLWKALRGRPRQIDSHLHDEILAISSHLPHIVAFALTDAVQSGYERRQINHSLGGGLKDMTRVVSSSPEMWSEICVDNQGPILKQIEVFEQSLSELHDLVKEGNVNALRQFFLDKKLFRDVLA